MIEGKDHSKVKGTNQEWKFCESKFGTREKVEGTDLCRRTSSPTKLTPICQIIHTLRALFSGMVSGYFNFCASCCDLVLKESSLCSRTGIPGMTFGE